MPVRAPRICACGKVVPSGIRCACQQKRDAERKARFDQRRPSARERGYTSKWDEARAAFLKAHPTCVMCGNAATVVDHVIRHKGDRKLFWSRANWQPLCMSCHSSRKQRLERREQP